MACQRLASRDFQRICRGAIQSVAHGQVRDNDIDHAAIWRVLGPSSVHRIGQAGEGAGGFRRQVDGGVAEASSAIEAVGEGRKSPMVSEIARRTSLVNRSRGTNG